MTASEKALLRCALFYGCFAASLISGLGVSTPAHAGGFAITEQSASALSTASSNTAAAEDASVIWYNPAGMAWLDLPEGNMTEITGGVIAVFGVGEVELDASKSTTSAGTPAPIVNGGEFGKDVPFPFGYAAHQVDTGSSFVDRISLGIGVTAPFGLGTNYDRNWTGRYNAIDSELLTVNVNPTIGIRFADTVSVALGISAQYAQLNLSQAIDTGVIIGAPAANDSFLDLGADNIGFGANAGIMVKVADNARVGLSYRSQISHSFSGDADFTNSASGALAAATFGVLMDTGIQSNIIFPDSASLHGYYQVNKYLSLFSDITWTNWSKVDTLTVDFDNPSQPAQSLILKMEDSWRFAVGGSYELSPKASVRAGFAYETSAQPDATRGFRIPDNERYTVAFGVDYEINERLDFSGAYTFVKVADAPISTSDPSLVPGMNNTASGTSELGVHAFALQLSYRF